MLKKLRSLIRFIRTHRLDVRWVRKYDKKPVKIPEAL
jgi:hypothetical protein